MTIPNASYRETWNKLAETGESALMHVTGYTDEARIAYETGRTLDLLRNSIGIRPGDTMLEIGCGVGRVGQQLARLIHHWIGCDVSDNMLSHAAQRLAGLPNVELQRVSGHDLRPVPDNHVDAVYSPVVFTHLDEWDRYTYVCEAYRVLKPGGRLYCDIVNIDTDEGWQVFMCGVAIPPGHRPHHLGRCATESEMSVYLRRAGFREVKTGTAGVWAMAWGNK